MNIHGVGLIIRHDGSDSAQDAASELARDFSAWPSTQESRGRQVELKLFSTAAPTLNAGIKLFSTRMNEVRGVGSSRLVDYGEKSGAILDAGSAEKLVIKIYSPSPDLLREISYSATLSLVGEQLDALGLHRVHALGISAYGKTLLCLLDEKSGKSTLAMALRSGPDIPVGFFSDETPLLNVEGVEGRAVRVLPYPNRIALTEEGAALTGTAGTRADSRIFRRRIFPTKKLFDWSGNEIAPISPLDFVLLDGGRTHSAPSFRRVSWQAAAAALSRSLVVGVGVAQMAEYLIRFNPSHLGLLARTAASRAQTAFHAARQAKAFVFDRSGDPRVNARALASFLRAPP